MGLDQTTQEYLQLIAKTIVNQADKPQSQDALIGELGGHVGVFKASNLLKNDLDTPDQLDEIHNSFKNGLILEEFGEEFLLAGPVAIP